MGKKDYATPPKMNHRLGLHLPPLANFIRKRKLIRECSDYLHKTYHNWAKTNNHKHLAFSKAREQIEGV